MRDDRLRLLISGIDADGADLSVAEKLRQRRLLGIPDDHVILANVARLYPEKAQDALLECFREIHEHCPETRLWILGVGPRERALRARCSRLGLRRVTRFLGHIEELRDCLRLADIQVHPSFAEGVPLAVCEGMAVGLPVVASAVGGLPEIIERDRSGLLVPNARDREFKNEFVQAVVRLSRSPEERARLGRGARQFIESQYSMRTAVDQLEALYRELV